MYNSKLYKTIKQIAPPKKETIYGVQVVTEVDQVMNVRTKKKYAVKKKTFPTSV